MLDGLPDSIINICSVPMKQGSPHTLIFKNGTEREEYFKNALGLRTIEGCTYIRKDGILRVPVPIEEIRRDNYIFYKNPSYHDRTWFCFIESMEYFNDNTTAIKIRTDPWITYMFDLRYRQCFVERETVKDDTVGLHTYPEGLEFGEYTGNGAGTRHIIARPAEARVVIATTTRANLTPPNYAGQTVQVENFYNGVYSGLYYFTFDAYDSESIEKFLEYFADASHGASSDAIVHMFMTPDKLLSNRLTKGGTLESSKIPDCTYYWIRSTQIQEDLMSFSVSKPSSLNGYTPRNNKLLTFPYCYFNMTNNAGAVADYHYEDFSSTPSFDVIGSLTVGCSVKAIPVNYKNSGTNYSYGLVGMKLPVCAWTSDVYTNWLTQNALNIENTETFGAVKAIGDIAQGNIASGSVNFLETISDLSAQQYQHSVQPPQANGDACAGEIGFSSGRYAFTTLPMCIRTEYARKIDDFFDLFGYKINRVKKPELFTRKEWNYIKTVGCALYGRIPNDMMEEINQMFDAGITFWHNPDHFLDYTLDNSIVD